MKHYPAGLEPSIFFFPCLVFLCPPSIEHGPPIEAVGINLKFCRLHILYMRIQNFLENMLWRLQCSMYASNGLSTTLLQTVLRFRVERVFGKVL